MIKQNTLSDQFWCLKVIIHKEGTIKRILFTCKENMFQLKTIIELRHVSDAYLFFLSVLHLLMSLYKHKIRSTVWHL